jgi:hypothetical protein
LAKISGIKDSHERTKQALAYFREMAEREGAGNADSGFDHSPDPKISKAELKKIASRVSGNRDALAILVASVIEQIIPLRKNVEQSNSLDMETRDGFLEFLDDLTAQLLKLKRLLPQSGQAVTEEKAGKLALWLREFMPLVKQKSLAYITPEKISDVIAPTGVILTCTAFGAMMGNSIAGGVFGAWLTGNLKPDKAIKDVVETDGVDDAN